MKKILLSSLILLIGVWFMACSSNPNQETAEVENNTAEATENVQSAEKSEGPIKVVYFHATRRCATCTAIENVCTSFLEKTYGDKVSFTSVNHEDDMNPLVTRYNVSSQALYVIQGSHKTDLTGTAFMNAKSRPEKLEEELKATIDKLL